MAADLTLAGLVRAVRGGAVLYPGTPGYDQARLVFNAMIDRRPAAIVRCSDADDVMVAVDHARALGLPLSVKGGGHSVAGTAVCDGGIMVDLSPMKTIQVDPDARVADAQPGLTLGEFDTRDPGISRVISAYYLRASADGRSRTSPDTGTFISNRHIKKATIRTQIPVGRKAKKRPLSATGVARTSTIRPRRPSSRWRRQRLVPDVATV
jgi:hypothetical protein